MNVSSVYGYSFLLASFIQVGIIALGHKEPLLSSSLTVLNIIFALLVYPMLLVVLLKRGPIPAKYGPHQ